MIKKVIIVAAVCLALCSFGFGQDQEENDPAKAEKIIETAIAKLGGAKYLNATTLVSEGRFSITEERKIASFQSFVDVVVYPDKERTDFNERGSKTVQVNINGGGWSYDELFSRFGDQNEAQLENFEKSLKTHYDYLLRGSWKEKAELSYKGRRQASLGVRNDVLRLEFEDGFWVEYEFDDDGFPAKTIYPSVNKEQVVINEENRYAQFILTNGIFFPFIVDHFSDGTRSYRVNYTDVQFNKRVPDSIFEKPSDPKKIKKLKL